MQVLGPGKSPCQLYQSQRVAVMLLLSLLRLAHWGSSALLREGARTGHLWVFKAVQGQAAQETEGLNTWN